MNGVFNPNLGDALTASEARTALNLAIDANDDSALATWAKRWGVAACEECGTGGKASMEDLQDEIDDLESELNEKDERIAELEGEIRELKASLKEGKPHD